MKNVLKILTVLAVIALTIFACNKSTDDVAFSDTAIVAPNGLLFANSPNALKNMVLDQIAPNYDRDISIQIDNYKFYTSDEQTFLMVYYTTDVGKQTTIGFYAEHSTSTDEAVYRDPAPILLGSLQCTGECDNGTDCYVEYNPDTNRAFCACNDGSHSNCTAHFGNALPEDF